MLANAATKAEVLAQVRARINEALGHKLSDREALQVAIAAGFRDNSDLLGFLLPSHVRRRAQQNHETFRINPDEWNNLFGCDAGPLLRDAGVGTIVNSREFDKISARLENALRHTIAEKEQSERWSKAPARLTSFIALHLDNPDTALRSVLGNVVKADARRLDDLQNELDDAGAEVILLSQSLNALCASL